MKIQVGIGVAVLFVALGGSRWRAAQGGGMRAVVAAPAPETRWDEGAGGGALLAGGGESADVESVEPERRKQRALAKPRSSRARTIDLTVVVQDTDGRAAAGIAFEFGAVGRRGGGKGVSDEEGRAALTFDVEAGTDPLENVWVTIVEPGYQQWTKWGDVLENGRAEAELTARTGTTIRGTLRDRNGVPTKGALKPIRPDGRARMGRDSYVHGGLFPTGDDGRFKLHVAEPGTHWFHAYSLEADGGTALLGPLEVSLESTLRGQDVRLQGPGRIRGVVVDRRGRPAAGLRVEASVSDADGLARNREESRFRGLGGGHAGRSAVTDDAGRFELSGLRNDLFWIRAQTVNLGSQLLIDRPVPSNGRPLELELTRPTLLVHVRNADGTPARPFSGEREYDRWPSEPCVTLYSLDGSEPQPVRLIGKRAGDASVRFEPYGGDWLIELRAPRQAPRFETVHVPADGTPVERSFLLDQRRGHGELELTMLAFGEPVYTDVPGSVFLGGIDTGLRLRVGTLEGPTWLLDTHRLSSDSWPFSRELPAGRYRLSIESEKMFSSCMGKPRFSTGPWGACSSEFTIVEGESTELRVELPGVSRITLLARGDVREEDRQVFECVAESNWGQPGDVRQRGFFANSFPTHPTFLAIWIEGEGLDGTLCFSNADGEPLLLNQRGFSDPVPAGSYTLTIRLPGGRRLTERVTVQAGEETPVVVDFGD